MLTRRLLHVFSLIAWTSMIGLLLRYIPPAGSEVHIETLPFRMAATYALAFAFVVTALCALLAGTLTLCRAFYRRALLLVTLGLVVCCALFDLATHVAQGDGISEVLAPEIGRFVFAASLGLVTTTFVAVLTGYAHSSTGVTPKVAP